MESMLIRYVIGLPEQYTTTTTSSSSSRPSHHIHAVLNTRRPYRPGTLRKILIKDSYFSPLGRVNIQISHNFEAARDYATKQGIFAEKITKSDKAADAEFVVRTLTESPTPAAIASLIQQKPSRLHQIASYQRYLSSILQMPTPESYPREVYYFYGDSRAGKSTHARDFLKAKARDNGDPELYDSVIWSAGFAQGYTGSAYVLIDDWHPVCLSTERWNQLFDNFACMVNVKGSQMYWKARYIVITRTHSPTDLRHYQLVLGDLLQIVNRLETTYLHVCEEIDGQKHYTVEEIPTSHRRDEIKDMMKAD